MALPAPRWHPIVDLIEPEPGVWELWNRTHDLDGAIPTSKYGQVRIVRHDGQLGYRCLMLPPGADAPLDLGIAPSLRDATVLVHRAHQIASSTRSGPEWSKYPDWGPKRSP